MMVQLFLRMDRNEEALREGARAIELEPASPTANAEYAAGLIANDRCEEALVRLAKVQSLQVPLLRVQSMLVRCYTRQRKWPDAIAAAERNIQRGGVSAQAMLAYTYGRAGRSADARKILATLLGRSGVDAIDIALVYAGLGENDQAFSWVDKGIGEASPGAAWGQLDFLFEALQADPRVEQYKRRLAAIQNR
jgi:tetratricopeptide (TPR) repeat protein